ncbi:MAG: M48 family metallopeptidase [Thermoleophilaceae bacterium]
MLRHRSGVPLAVAAAIVAAGAATILLRPRSGLIDPQAVEASAYFTADQIERAQAFRGPQRALGLVELGLSTAALALLALRPPRVVRRALERASRRPYLGGAAAGAALAAGVAVLVLPIDAVQHDRAVDVGLSTQDWSPWLVDLAKSTGIGALFAGLITAGALVLIRRFPRHWWLPGSAGVALIAALYIYVAPVALDPLFNDFEPLPRGELRSDVMALAERAGVDVGEVYRIDASRRTTGANAYVGGLGHTKRVVLYDNLIEEFPPEQVRVVVAHELAHVENRDLLRGLAWIAIVAPFGVLLIKRLTDRWAPREARGAGASALTVPALTLAFVLVSFAAGSAGNVLSRDVEAAADVFALRLTGDPAAFVGFERRITVTNVSEPDPPAFFHRLFSTHPTTVERIGIGLSAARRQGEEGTPGGP